MISVVFDLCFAFCLIFCAIQAMRASRLLAAALWLAANSALLALTLYLLGAHEVAVIELSVGAGLVTVLFVFAISIAGEETIATSGLVPRSAIWILVAGVVLLLGWLILPANSLRLPATESSFATMLWEQRGLDMMVQIVVIFAGVLGVLVLLAETETSPETYTFRPTEPAHESSPPVSEPHPRR